MLKKRAAFMKKIARGTVAVFNFCAVSGCGWAIGIDEKELAAARELGKRVAELTAVNKRCLSQSP
jgi:hypothetical protein